MTKEDYAALIKKAGVGRYGMVNNDQLELLIDLATTAERSACAKLCDRLANGGKDMGIWADEDKDIEQGVRAGAALCAATIRARGKKTGK